MLRAHINIIPSQKDVVHRDNKKIQKEIDKNKEAFFSNGGEIQVCETGVSGRSKTSYSHSDVNRLTIENRKRNKPRMLRSNT